MGLGGGVGIKKIITDIIKATKKEIRRFYGDAKLLGRRLEQRMTCKPTRRKGEGDN